MPRIDCINKTDQYFPWERIRAFGGPNPNGKRWKLTHEQMIVAIEHNTYGEFYVERPAGARVRCIVALSAHGIKYVKTEADREEQPHNLLILPECP